MSHVRTNHAIQHPGNAQKGAAFIVMLVILVLGVAGVMVNSLNSAGARIERDVKTSEVLALARDTLISEAAIEVNLASHHYPGSLPCPDTDDDGSANAGGSGDCPQYIGRLPWKTLGLPDLRDASGERLWYTLSRNVRRYGSVRFLNSDKAGTLNLTGTYSDSDLMAIIFSPGDNVSGQSRSENTALCSTTSTSIIENRCAANYLEGSNANLSNGTTQNLNYQNMNSVALLNDKLVTVSRDRLMERTEKRVGGEIRKILKTYYEAWGAFPFPALLDNPSTASFTGLVGNYEGLLPVGDSGQPTWVGIPSVSFGGSGSVSSCELRDGVAASSRWRCLDISISAGETITITGTLNNIGRGLWRPHHTSNICEVRARNSSGTNVLATSVLDDVTVEGTLNSDGSATIVFQAKGKAGYSTLQRIELRDILDYTSDIKSYNNASPTCPQTPTSPTIPKWLFDDATDGNDWHTLVFYAVAEEYAPGGNHSCSPTPCLTVNGQNGGTDIPALIVMSGRTLANPHPSDSLSDYLEGENQSIGDRTFENQTRSSTFNDQVFIITP